MTDPNIQCINESIRVAETELNNELWDHGKTELSVVILGRLNRLRERRNNGELYEIKF